MAAASGTAPSTPAVITIYGTYEHDGETAVLKDMSTEINGLTITFTEAHRNGDTLFLLWRVEDAVYPFTTALPPEVPKMLPRTAPVRKNQDRELSHLIHSRTP